MTSQARPRVLRPTAGSAEAAEAAVRERSAVPGDHTEACFVELCQVALQVGPAGATASLTVVEEQRVRNVWSSDRATTRLDAVQYRAHGGPTLKAAAGTGWETAPIGELIGTRACPALTAAAGRDGIGSLLSVSLAFYAPALILPTRGQRPTYGSLTLYAPHPDAFTQAVIDTLLTVTGHVALALTAQARVGAAEQARQDLVEQMREGLESRTVIGRAQGILMERYKVSAPEAVEFLRRASMSRHRKVRQLAEEVVGASARTQVGSDEFDDDDLVSAHARLRELGVDLKDLTGAR